MISPRVIAAIVAAALAVIVLLTGDLPRELILLAVAVIVLAVGLVVP